MEEIAFKDWPGQPVELSENNPWYPAYGYQPPNNILDKEDFLGSPDAALFLNGTAAHQYVFLETIVEETSDDLCSDSDRSASRADSGPLGWLATDSESGSVIRVDVAGLGNYSKLTLDDDDNTSECDLICPPKRRRHDTNLLTVNFTYSDEESCSLPSLSRSSSLLQFENLEKRCQEDIYSSSPSILSNLSYDSLEKRRKRNDLSPDSLNSDSDDSDSYKSDSDYYKSIKIDGGGGKSKNKKSSYRDSLFYKTRVLDSKYCDADTESQSSSDESSERSSETLLKDSRSNSLKSMQNLKSFQSFDDLNIRFQKHGNKKTRSTDKISAENLSEDSGYCDHQYMKHKSTSIPNFHVQGIVIPENSTTKPNSELKKTYKRTTVEFLDVKSAVKPTKSFNSFHAYDGENLFQTTSACSHFGASYQDLSIFDPNKTDYQKILLDRIKSLSPKLANNAHESTNACEDIPSTQRQQQRHLNIETASEFVRTAKNNDAATASSSEPNLHFISADDSHRNEHEFTDCFVKDTRHNKEEFAKNIDRFQFSNKPCYFDNGAVCIVSSVPTNLNLAGEISDVSLLTPADDNWYFNSAKPTSPSVAVKNWDLCDISKSDLHFTDNFNSLIACGDSDRCEVNNDVDELFIHEDSRMADTRANISAPREEQNVKVNSATNTSTSFDRHYTKNHSKNVKKCSDDDDDEEEELSRSSFHMSDGISKLLDVTSDDKCYNLDIHSDIIEFEENLEKAISNSSIPSFTDKADYFFHSTPMNRRNVLSTPNLTTFTSEIDFIENIHQNAVARNSMNTVPLKNSPDRTTNNFDKGLSGSEGKNVGGILHSNMKSSLPGSTGSSVTKGVHFCEVVSEVSWREASYSDQSEFSDSSDSSEHRRRTHDNDSEEEEDYNATVTPKVVIEHVDDAGLVQVSPVDLYNNSSICEIQNDNDDINDMAVTTKQNENNINIEQETTYINNRADADRIAYTKHLDNICKRNSLPLLPVTCVDVNGDPRRASASEMTTLVSHVGSKPGESKQRSGTVVVEEPYVNKLVAAMESKSDVSTVHVTAVNAPSAQQQGPNNNQLKRSKNSANKLGGFLSRFTNFRFSTRGSNKKKNNTNVSTANVVASDNNKIKNNTEKANDGSATTDYIYIPLKGPLHIEEDADTKSTTNKTISKILIDGKPVENNNAATSVDERVKFDSAPNNNNSGDGVGVVNKVGLSSKPPLPKLPPRVISASVKRQHSNSAAAATQAQQSTTGDSVYQHHIIDSSSRGGKFNPVSVNSGVIANGGASSGVFVNSSGPRNHGSGVPRHLGTGGDYYYDSRDPMERKPLGLIETDLDTHITIVAGPNGKTRSLMNLPGGGAGVSYGGIVSGSQDIADTPGHRLHLHLNHQQAVDGSLTRPHKSMEFLLDKQNLKVVEPPENELQKNTGERVMSEHQLRVQRSIQKLTVPEWFKQSQVPREGFLLKKRETQKWPGLGNKTTSLSSLGGGSRQSPVLLSPSPQGYAGGFQRWSTSKLNSAASSPCNSTRSSFNYRQPVANLTSNGITSPCASTRSSFNYRQPYLGWRSQERLSRPRTPAERLATSLLPPPSTTAATAANSEIQSSIKEVTSAIVHYVSGLQPEANQTHGESLGVTRTDSRGSSPRYDRESASTSPRLRDYETQDTASQRSISPASRGSQKLCWLESSFVGTRPLDSPQTPMGLPADVSVETVRAANFPGLHLDLKTKTTVDQDVCTQFSSSSISSRNLGIPVPTRPSPGSTTLEDVLDSLLGLPPATRAPSPSLQETASVNSSPEHIGSTGISSSRKRVDSTSSSIGYYESAARRRSEGYTDHHQRPSPQSSARRVSFHVTPVSPGPEESFNAIPNTLTISTTVRCKYTKCTNSASSEDAKKYFKNCHNCSYVYCSRECRRAHWEKHRKTCLHSRASSLCRQILAKAKDDPETLRHVSVIARRGYLAHGPGVVKCFFPSPEAAERFVSEGLVHLSEPTYVRWPDLLPSEMGPELFSELVKICKSYNPETRLVLYVAVCVVSEVPATGTIKWERQLVSRCAKLRLSKSIQPDGTASQITQPHRPKSPCNITREMDNPETLILTSLPGCKNQTSVQRSREISFTNIQRQLKQRGVSLRRHFPDVYQKLCAYVEGASDKFAPVTVYPRDGASGKSFMCIIMPDVEPDKLEMVPTDSSRVQTIDVGRDQE